MRQHPKEDSDVVSQALFGEQVLISDRAVNWLYITTPDGYSGWIKADGLSETKYSITHYTSRISVPLYREKGIRKGPLLLLPFGVGVHVVGGDSDWAEMLLPSGRVVFTQRGNLSSSPLLLRENLESFVQQFLGLPYIWGGRSSFGFDCSGFIQMLYQQMGVSLPRDSSDQIKVLQEQTAKTLVPGDLIFWGITPEKIGHVGCFLGEGRFIHATARENQPWLRISLLSDPVWSGAQESIYPHRSFRFCTKFCR